MKKHYQLIIAASTLIALSIIPIGCKGRGPKAPPAGEASVRTAYNIGAEPPTDDSSYFTDSRDNQKDTTPKRYKLAEYELLLDEAKMKVCVLKDKAQKQYCCNIPGFGHYGPEELDFQNGEITVSYTLYKVSTIGATVTFDDVSNTFTLDAETTFPHHMDHDGGVKVCRMKIGLGKHIDDMDSDTLLNKLTDQANCHTEYNLWPFKYTFETIVYESKEDKYFLKRRIDTYGYRNDIERYSAYFKTYPLSDSNYAMYNDIGYYLEQAEAYKEAIYVLSAVLEKYPERIVAYLNIADAYWGDGEKARAKEAYEKYAYLMKAQKKDMSKIPKRVYDRIAIAEK